MVKIIRNDHRYNNEEKTSRINTGTPTNKLVFSTHFSTNKDVFPLILGMYVHDNDDIADVTYGKSVFWKKVDRTKYHLSASDIKTKFIPRDCVGGIDDGIGGLFGDVT